MKQSLCKCGCGKLVMRNQQNRQWNKYVHGHNSFGRLWSQVSRDKARAIQLKNQTNVGKHNSPDTEFKKGQHPSSATEFKTGSAGHKGHHHSEETKEKIREFYRKRRIISFCAKCKKEISLIPFRVKHNIHHFCSRFCALKYHSGSKNNKWRGGITPKHVKIRTSVKGTNWRKAVFKRDDFICLICKKRGGRLCAHHIMSFASFPDKRFDVSNGITLCEACHKNLHRKQKERTGKKW